MCYGCYEEAGSPDVINDKTKAVAGLVATVYRYSPVGGNAHIVLDDWNLEDENIQWCLGVSLAENICEASDEQLAAERSCLEALLALTPAERASAIALYDGFLSPEPPNAVINGAQ